MEEQKQQPCEHCGATEAEYVRNPYDYDVNNTEVWEWMCEDCEGASADEI